MEPKSVNNTSMAYLQSDKISGELISSFLINLILILIR